MSEPSRFYQTVTLVTSDGRRLTYTGRSQMDQINPPRIVEVIASTSKPLPAGMVWDTLDVPSVEEQEENNA